MKSLFSLSGLLLVLVGLLAAVWPLVSVARLTGEVLQEVPSLPGVQVQEDRHVLSAMWSDDFVLAERRFPSGVSVQDVTDALGEDFVRGGFTSGSFDDSSRSRSCCGAYDAVLVSTNVGPTGLVTQTMTVYDSDVQGVWALFIFIGLVLGGGGVGLLLIGFRRSDPERPAAEGSPVPAATQA